jgi:hypothetical protein
VYVGTEVGIVRVFDARNLSAALKSIALVTSPATASAGPRAIASIVLSPAQLAFASHDGSVGVVALADDAITVHHRHEDFASSVAVSEDRIASVSLDKTLFVR